MMKKDEEKNEPLPGLKPGVSGLWHVWHDLRPCQTMPEITPLRQVPPGFASKGCHSSPGLKAWGFLACFMKTYITQGQPHYEVVLSVAIIAIARKVIILDLKEVDSLSLIGIASIIVALTVGYFLMKRSQSNDKAE